MGNSPIYIGTFELVYDLEIICTTFFQIAQTSALQNRSSVLERRSKMVDDFLARYQLTNGNKQYGSVFKCFIIFVFSTEFWTKFRQVFKMTS